MSRARRLLPEMLIAPAAWLLAPTAFGHGGEVHSYAPLTPGPSTVHELSRAWEWDPLVIIALLASALIYAAGVARMWRAGVGRGIRAVDALCFAGGWLVLVIALVSPLHAWGGVLFSAHMTQHELLMLVAAPLLVLSRPLVAFLKALPRASVRRVVRMAKAPAWARVWGVFTNAFVAWMIHAVVLWVWHVPAMFEATFDDDLIHALQHMSFLFSALLFWWAVMNGPQRVMGYGLAVLYMFTTAIHSGLLGALITFASTAWYPSYSGRTDAWGLSALEDQQLGGLIMWIPACLVYVFAGLALFAAWLRGSEQRVLLWDAQWDDAAPVRAETHEAQPS